MILSRYLSKDIFSYTASVSLIFLFIILSSRSIQYLEQAARGELNPELVFWVVLYRLPEFLELIIPFSFFLSIILVLGRLYSENEMTIMEQTGFSSSYIMKLLFLMGIFFAIFTSVFSTWLTPQLSRNVDQILDKRSFQDDFRAIQPGTFHTLREGLVIFARDRKDHELESVFVKFYEGDDSYKGFISAKRANLDQNNPYLLVLNEGFSFSEDKENLIRLSFKKLQVNLKETSSQKKLSSGKVEKNLESLQWRLSTPLLCLISVLLAVPLSKVNPRKRRYRRVLPSMLIFISYLGLLLLFRTWLEQEAIPSFPGIFTVHLIFLFLSIFLINKNIGFKQKP